MTNQTSQTEFFNHKKDILDAMSRYMQSFENKDVTIPLNLTACETVLRTHLDGVLLQSAWSDPDNVVFKISYFLHSLGTSGFGPMLAGASAIPSDADTQQKFLEECRTIIEGTLDTLLTPDAMADIPALIYALRLTMHGLANVSFDAMREEISRKAPGYQPYGYTDAEITECDKVLTHYLATVQSVTVRNDAAKIMAAVQLAIESLNELNDRCGGSLIETDGREEICQLIQDAAESAGLACSDTDITEEWPEW